MTGLRDRWVRQLQEHPDRPQGRQHRQLEVLLALAGKLDPKSGEGNVSVQELAELTGISQRTAKRSLSWARGAGLLEQTSRGRRRGDGTTSASAWRLLGAPEPQGDRSASQRANPEPQGANSRSQGARAAKTSVPRSSSRKSRSRGTYTPPKAQEVLGHHWCVGCGFAVDPHLVAEGILLHPGCTDPLDEPARSQA
jgi:hypothetical protein